MDTKTSRHPTLKQLPHTEVPAAPDDFPVADTDAALAAFDPTAPLEPSPEGDDEAEKDEDEG